MSSRLAAACLIPLAALLLLANRGVRESYDLRPRFETGQELSIVTEGSGLLELLEATVQFGPETLPEEPMFDAEFSFSMASDTTILKAEDGEIQQLRLKLTSSEKSIEGELNVMGQSMPFDESSDSENVGHTIEITRGEDGELEIEDVTDDPDMEALSDDEIDEMEMEQHFELLLPVESVEVGDSWDLMPRIKEQFQRLMDRAERDVEEDQELLAVISLIEDVTSVEFTGTLVSVDGSIAKLEWTLEISLDELDIFEVVRATGAEEEMGEGFPDDVNATFSANLEMTGKGSFDLEAHQLTEFSFEGEYTLQLDSEGEAEGMEISADLEFDGTLEFSGGVEVQ